MIVNVAGCGAMLKDYGHHWHDDDNRAASVRRESERRQRVSRRARAGAPAGRNRADGHVSRRLPSGPRPENPRGPAELLARFPGLELRDLPETELCCGAAGTYNLTEPEMAERLSRRKLENIFSTGADVVITANAGCLLQIAREAKQQGERLRIDHPMDLLDLSYRKKGRSVR